MRRIGTLSVLLLMGLWACRPPRELNNVPPAPSTFVYPNFFADGTTRLLFKTRLRLAKEEFSGLLLVKRTTPDTYRSVFTTETGFKIFDLEIRNDGYTTHYGVGPIEKKFIAVRLAYTLQALLLRPFPEATELSVYGDTRTATFRVARYTYRLQTEAGKPVTQTVLFKGGRKCEARFSDFGTDSLPDSARVTHSGFPLDAGFKFLKQ